MPSKGIRRCSRSTPQVYKAAWARKKFGDSYDRESKLQDTLREIKHLQISGWCGIHDSNKAISWAHTMSPGNWLGCGERIYGASKSLKGSQKSSQGSPRSIKKSTENQTQEKTSKTAPNIATGSSATSKERLVGLDLGPRAAPLRAR